MLAVKMKEVSYCYPGEEQNALDGIDLAVAPGEFVVVGGPCSSGKSSLCLLAAGLIPHFYKGRLQGEVEIFGHEISRCESGKPESGAGLVLQNPFAQLSGTCFTVGEEVALGLENMGVAPEIIERKVAAVLEILQIGDLFPRDPATLSGGQVQRVVLASTLVMDSMLLILDEPASQLDPRGQEDLFLLASNLAHQGRTVIMVERDLEKAARYADRLLIINRGRIVLDGPARETAASPGLEDHGLVPVRYTAAALLGREKGLWPKDCPLPATLEQAKEGFSK